MEFTARLWLRGTLAMGIGIIMEFLFVFLGTCFFGSIESVRLFLTASTSTHLWTGFIIFHVLGWVVAYFAMRE